MLDISAMTERYNLTPDQANRLEASYRSLPQDKQDNFGINDFELLMDNQGIKRLGAQGEELPNLPKSKLSAAITSDFVAIASPGAAIMALLTENAADQRQINKELKAAQSESTAQLIESQADDLREKAVIQLALGIVSGAISIAGGIVTASKAVIALNSTDTSKNFAMQTNAKLNAESQAYQGGSSLASTVSTFFGTKIDAKIKETDATIERSRSNVESLKDINEALTELIKKALSSAEAIQESANQARSKILA